MIPCACVSPISVYSVYNIGIDVLNDFQNEDEKDCIEEMKPIEKKQVEKMLSQFVGAKVYVHSEATSYMFARNFRIDLTEAFIAGDGPYRVALRYDGHGWLRIEGLTHAELDDQERLLLEGFDDQGRMDVALHLGKEPFPE